MSASNGRNRCFQQVIAVLNPPIPSSSSQCPGQQLLHLVRTLGKLSGVDGLDCTEETVECLQRLVVSIQRRGLLAGDTVTAQKLLLARQSSYTSSSHHEGKKKRNKRSTSSEMSPSVSAQQTPVVTLDVQLIMASIERIFTDAKKTTSEDPSSSQRNPNSDQLLLLAPLAADVCCSASEFIKSSSLNDSESSESSCMIAEYELLASSCKVILGGLENCLRTLSSHLHEVVETNNESDDALIDDHEEYVNASRSCLRAAASLIGLFGTKLSRSYASILTGLRESASRYLLLSSDDDGLQTAASKLLATISWVGDRGRTPSQLWGQSLSETVSAFSRILRDVAPMQNKSKTIKLGEITSSQQREGSSTGSFFASHLLEDQITRIGEAPSETLRASIFLRACSGLAKHVVELLSRDSISSTNPVQILAPEAVVDVESILSLVEALLSFSSASEAVYYGTKKRLRSEATALEGSMFSPAALAGVISNPLRMLGHKVLDIAIATLGEATLLPFTTRILSISYAALLTSTSSTLRKLTDPTTASFSSDENRKRWLHASVAVRTAAIKSFEGFVVVFGTDPRVNSSTSGLNTVCDVDRALTLVCACIVEELSGSHLPQEKWGTLQERVELVATATGCLAACLSSGGEFLATSVRRLLDSTVGNCLTLIVGVANPVASSDITKTSILRLGTASLCTPWQDGASSNIRATLKTASEACRRDTDTAVGLAASLALRMCEEQECTRSLALHVVTRNEPLEKTSEASKRLGTFEAMTDRLQKAREEFGWAESRQGVLIDDPNSRDGHEKSSYDEEKSSATSDVHPKTKKTKVEDPRTPLTANADATQVGLSDEKERASVATPNPAPAPITRDVSAPEGPVPTKGKSEGLNGVAKNKIAGVHDTGTDDDDFPLIVDCAPDEGDD
jgi:hypothetical protein